MHDSNACAQRASFPSSLFLPAIILLLLLIFPISNFGQAGDASISGRVSDPAGRVVQQAEVTIKNVATDVNAVTTTNEAGIYTFPSLQPGNYVLTVHKQGFQSVDLVDLTLYTQDRLERNFALSVGSTSESVTVNGGTTNESPAVSMTVDREFVENMPLNGRSFQDLIQLAPGAVSVDGNGSGLYSIDGQRTDSNNFTVDGVSANLGGLINTGGNSGGGGAFMAGGLPAQTAIGTTQSLASVDSLQEFTIQTSGYAAEYGRNPGAQIQFTTRSGTNNLHGTIFEYLRNTDFDANSYSNDYNHDPQTAEHQNDFGGTLGGPLTIPRLYNGKDRTFYFLSYEGLRLLLPTYEEKYNPTQGFRNWASPNILPYLKTAPLPNQGNNIDGCTITDPTTGQLADCDGIFYAGYSYPNNLDSYSARIDHSFSRRFHGFVRYADSPSFTSIGLESIDKSNVNVHEWTAGLTSTISRNLLDELRFNYSHDGEQSAVTPHAYDEAVPESRNLLIPGAYDGPYAWGEGRITVPNTHISVSADDMENSGSVLHQYQLVDSLAWTKGAHSLKVGVDWRRLISDYSYLTYLSEFTTRGLSDIHEGNATSMITQNVAAGNPIFINLSFYAQDHWKVWPTLSLDYGLRWDFNPPPGPSNGHYPASLTSNNLMTTGLTDTNSQPYQTDYHCFAPRLGFAWNAIPTPHHAVTIRAGAGIFWDTAQQTIGRAYQDVYPFGVTSPTYSEVPMPFSASVLTPPALSTTLSTPYPAINQAAYPDLTAPYTEQWNLSVDAAVNQKNTLTLTYVGNSGRKLLFNAEYFTVPGNANFSSDLYVTGNGASSNYNALQIQDVGRIINGLDIVGSFTWAHALDNASNDYSLATPIYGNSDNDLRRSLNLAVNYQSHGISANRWIQSVTNSWMLANRFSVQSGSPLNPNIIESYVILPNGNVIVYSPNLVPGVPIYLHGTAASGSPIGWRLNRAAFSCTTEPVGQGTSGACTGTPTTEGTLGRNYVRGPAFWTLNSSVQRDFPIYERLHLNFRVDAFNIFNHPNLTSPDTTLSDATFGELNSGSIETIGSPNTFYAMGAARSLQFSLKLQF